MEEKTAMKENEHKEPAGHKILFVCSHNEMRSSTAETVYREEGLNVLSAGTERSANVPVSSELIRWADLILVMENKHMVAIETHFGDEVRNKKIIVLDIPDNYYYMEPELVSLIRERADPYLNPR